MKTSGKLLFASLLVFALPVLAQAHPGHDGHDLTWSFSTGFDHPLGGWDHLLAMLAVGVWAAQLGGRARWLIPTAFIATMSLSAALAQNGLALSVIEQGLAASLFISGLLIAAANQLPVVVSVSVASLFALFHGSAHGAEMPANASGLSYGLGFVAATTLLLLAGLGLGFALQKQALITRIAGGAVAAAGALAFVS